MTLSRHVRRFAREALKRAGYDIVRTDENLAPASRRVRLLREHGVDLVLDVGANIGQYGWELRNHGYAGRIVSFEPLSGPFRELAGLSAQRPPWTAVNIGLGDRSGTATIHVAGNSECSSLLPLSARQTEADASVRYVAEEVVRMSTLREVWDDHCGPGDRAYVKIDAQGFERHIIRGAGPVLHRAVGIQLELSFTPLYEGETPFREMVDEMRSLGFLLRTVEPMYVDPTSGELLQLDAVFFRRRS